MARPRLPIAPHLSHDESARRSRACRQGIEKTHWQVLWLLTRPEAPPTPAQVAEQVGLTAGWVRAILKRWNAAGPTAWPIAAPPPTAASPS
jgi:DNA-binding MarR family transcriptional regulator